MVLYLQKICRDSTDESHKLLSFSYCYHPTLAEYISHNLKKNIIGTLLLTQLVNVFGFQQFSLMSFLLFPSHIQDTLLQGSPTSWPRIRGQELHCRRWAEGKWAKLQLYLQLLRIIGITKWAPPAFQISCSIRVP